MNPIQFSGYIDLGNVLTLGTIIFSAGGLWVRVRSIEKKLDAFVSREVLDEKQRAADLEHASIRREINGLRSEFHHET